MKDLLSLLSGTESNSVECIYLNVELRKRHQDPVTEANNQTTNVETRDAVRGHHYNVGNIDQEN